MKQKHLTEKDRYYIEKALKQKQSVKQIALALGKHRATIYREIKRGLREHRKSADWSIKLIYCADSAQEDYIEKKKKTGRKEKLSSDDDFLKYAAYMILQKKYSPEALFYKTKHRKICVKTLYNYIHKGYIRDVTVCNLPYAKPKRKVKKKKVVKRPFERGRSIELRPKHIENRAEYGHWEMDTVYSARSDKSCLLVLSERMTREEIIIKCRDRTRDSIIKALNRYEKKIGAPAFRHKFLTITCDNGMEFANWKAIEKSCLNKGKRTSVYFCHPYCSMERGTNENINRMIRRWIPKYDDIGMYTTAEIQQIQEWINDYPRGLFQGLSAKEYKNATVYF